MQRALAFTNAQKKIDLTQKKQPYRAIEDGDTRIYPVEKNPRAGPHRLWSGVCLPSDHPPWRPV